MKRRIFTSIFFASLLTLILTFAFVSAILYNNAATSIKREVRNESIYISEAIKSYNENIIDISSYLNSAGAKSLNRITLISSDGIVTYDNFAQIQTMDNHSDRPEFIDAMKTGQGEITRFSDTLGESTYYYALKLNNNDVLRIASTTKSILGIVTESIVWFILIFIFIIVISLLIARLLTKVVVKPINKLDLDNPLSNDTYEELSPLLLRMEKQKKEIKNRMDELTKTRDDFNFITDNMSEGLVIFSEKGYVLASNKSANKILGISQKQYYLESCRDSSYIELIESSLNGKPHTAKINRSGYTYQLFASPVKEESKNFATVLFITDITEKDQAEQRRKEFSANVSHELKTPLTSILGYAELISKEIAKKEDIPHFGELIHREAARLLQVIEDIIKLSKLDEADLVKEFEDVRLDELCLTVINDLKQKALGYKVKCSFKGQETIIKGYSPILYEMIYNLCDNAIVYNKAEGSVILTLEKNDNKAVLTVADTGIGIPQEHLPRVFERFYRVDKSHSKDTGGTGLGLSIVKHAASLHDAKIDISSKINKGTKISISFNIN
ncbi:MAG: PAS domain-containing sensor histidine kinase [Clostridiaceae bacterium]|nr:PAS domain-containing sensor histidine kinase [Clostridiaceae bacterium]